MPPILKILLTLFFTATVDTDSAPLFERVQPEASGLDFRYTWTPPERYDHEMVNATTGGGICAGDFDGDGFVDLFLTQPFGGNRLYRNTGKFGFEEVTEKAGLSEARWGTGASFADVDNDGDQDLYVCGYDCANRFYLNNGDGTFRECAAERGLDYKGASVMIAFADYDCDGDLDAYLLTNHIAPKVAPLWKYETRKSDGMPLLPEELKGEARVLYRPDIRQGKLIPAGERDRLFQNDGRGVFTDVTEKSGLSDEFFGLGVVWFDHNADGWPDLYVSNDFWGPDLLYQNNGDGTFTNITLQALPHTPWFSMGCDIADINNDGHLDLMASDMAGTTHYKQKLSMGDMQGWFLTYSRPLQYMRNALYLNTGTGRYMEIAHMAGVASTDWTWSLKFGDLDNDGYEDLFVSNGAERFWDNSDIMKDARGAQRIDTPELKALWLPQPKRDDPNLAFRNTGDLEFESVGETWGLSDNLVSYGVAMADFDNDGDLDLATNNFDDTAALYRNRGSGRKSLMLRLRGKKINRDGIGALVTAETGGVTQTRYVTLARGFMSANDARVHIGTGDTESVESVTVRWPGGNREIFRNVKTGRIHELVEGAGSQESMKKKKPAAPLFRYSSSLEKAGSPEKRFDDFQRQPLLPNSLTQLGPGVAFSDVDGDGWDDFYIARPRDVGGALFFHTGNVREDGGVDFRMKQSPAFHSDGGCEDMSPLFFDADGDGDLDLLVTSGSVEKAPGDESYRDRLYTNRGDGRFFPAPAGAMPDLRLSSSVACAADVDQDGDLDVFIGTRVVPGAYPVAAPSHLLRNDGKGKFEAEPVEAGLVTGALWSDADDDGWPDLLITREWGAVTVLPNLGGRLGEPLAVTESGWWNSIAGRDLDNDGDLDYVAGNFGLNTKYHPSKGHPARIYYGDFDGSGKSRIIEAKAGDSLLPVRGKSCSQNAMPKLRERFPTFHSFASATLEEIYTEPLLESALMHEATELRTGILWNDGGFKFRFEPLPRMAQASPVFGIALTDVDADGWCDIYLAGNFFGPQAETGRMDGGVSVLLRGAGGGKFETVAVEWSGLLVPQDAKGLAVTDLNKDGRPDFVVALNAGPLLTFFNECTAAGLKVRAPVGSRIEADGQSAEISAGGGYLSQSGPEVYFSRVKKVRVRLPGGEWQEREVKEGETELVFP